MQRVKRFLTSFRTWILIPLAFQGIHRGITTFPFFGTEAPAPLIGTAAPLLFSVLWFAAGVALAMSAFGAHRWVIFSPGGSVAKIKFDDVAVLLFLGLTLVWGLSYYIDFWISLLQHHPNNGNFSGRNFLTWGISGVLVWAVFFASRTEREVLQEPFDPDKILQSEPTTDEQFYERKHL